MPPTTRTTPRNLFPYRPLYVLGLAFPEQLMRPIAEALCTAEKIRNLGSHHAAVVSQLRKRGIKQTIVPIWDPVARKAHYVWVLACSPSVNGGKPPTALRLPPGESSALLQSLRARGVEDAVLDTFVETLVQWPSNFVQPVWAPEKVEETKRIVEAARARVLARKIAEEKGLETSGLMDAT